MFFSIKEAFKFTFKTVKKNFVAVFTVSILYAACIFIFFKIRITNRELALAIAKDLVPLIATFVIICSLTNVFLYVFDGSPIKFKYYFPGLKKILKIFAVLTVYFCMLGSLVIFLLVLHHFLHFSVEIDSYTILMIDCINCLVSCKYGFFMIRLLENEESVINALKYSAKITLGNRNKIFCLLLMLDIIVTLITRWLGKYYLSCECVFAFLLPLDILIKLSVYKQLSFLQTERINTEK
ncbi:MAG: hypothetical protein LBU29_02135 [Endomicrobium sp.]|jgi:hypothetical protein|nr:hypothetical protein [Endomicrobium sp.]